MSAPGGLARVLVALDLPTPAQSWALVERIGPRVGGFKVGPALFLRQGPAAVRQLVAAGRRVFLDMKFHDIPLTVAESVAAACELGAALCTVHGQGGPAMLEAAARAARRFGPERTAVLAVTVLTSMAEATVEEVVALARTAQAAGCDGVICSPLEAAEVRRACGPGFRIVTPGIRLAAAGDDQARVSTPSRAVADGADYLVIGRPIYAAPDPLAALDAIERDLAGG